MFGEKEWGNALHLVCPGGRSGTWMTPEKKSLKDSQENSLPYEGETAEKSKRERVERIGDH